MRTRLAAQLEEFTEKTDKAILAVTRQSIQELVNQAQTPVAKGGHMRVKTGFLRSSGTASLNTLPVGPDIRLSDEPNSYAWAETNLTATLGEMDLGDTLYFGWTANYAEVRERYDGFVETASQDWQAIVNRNVEKLKATLS